MQKLRVGVVGSGAMGKSHIRIYSELNNVDLVAVCDKNKEEIRNLKGKYHLSTYNNVEDMLKNEKLDAVSVCVPTKYHKDIGLKFIDNNINVLIEKPLATNTIEAKEIVRKAENKKVKLLVGHIERFNPAVRELKKRIGNNELGKIYKVQCNRMSPFPQRVIDVGVVIDLAVHEIDIIRYLVNAKIHRIYAETAQRIHSKHEDLMVGTLRFENNILGIINVNWVTPKKIREITITGEKGMFKANYLTQDIVFYENDFANKKFKYSEDTLMSVVEGKSYPIKINKEEPLKIELKSFVDCIVNDKPPYVTGQDGIEALKIAEKLIQSAKENKVIVL